MLTLAFLLPMSVEWEVITGVKLLVPTEPLIALLALSFIFRLLELLRKREFEIRRVNVFLFLLVVMTIGSWLSSDLMISLKFTLIYGAYLFVFVGYFFLFPSGASMDKRFRRLLTAYSLGLVPVFVWSIYQWSLYGFNLMTLPGIFEPFYADHTIFGASAVMVFLFWSSLWFVKKRFRRKTQAFIMSFICLLMIVMAGSRAALLSIPIALCAYISFMIGLRIRHLLMGALSLVIIGTLFRGTIKDAFVYNDYNSRDEHATLAERTASVTNVQTDVSNIERLNRWVAALNMAREKPIFGFGPGTFQYAYIPYQDQRWDNRLAVHNPYDIPENSGGTVHSEPLLFLSELGIMGLVAWILVLGTLVKRSFTLPKSRRNHIQAMALSLFSSYLFHGLFNNFLTTDKFAFLFWMSVGFLFLTTQHAVRKQSILS